MKKSIIIAIVFVFLFSSLVDSIAACPTGFSPGPTRITQQVNPNCRIVIDYCISDVPGSMGTYDVYISGVSYFGNCALQTNPPTFPPVDWELVLATIMIDNPSKYDYIGLCPESIIHVRVFNGSCFWRQQGLRLNENGELEWCDYYLPCGMEGLQSCRQYYTACLQLIYPNYVVVVNAGPIQTLFSCIDPDGVCMHLCE